MSLLIIRCLEAIYIWYMYTQFKTRISYNHPFEADILKFKILKSDFFQHPISTSKYGSKICPLGHLVGWLLPIWMVLYTLSQNKLPFLTTLHKIIWALVFVISFILNFNAWLYLVPVFMVESYLISNNITTNKPVNPTV